jgi:LPXTG-site transpeptidase (sortase) family protein
MNMVGFLKKNIRGIALLLVGIGLLFVGAAGAFNLLEQAQPNEFVGQEVPRDMIESAYAASVDETALDDQVQSAGFDPFFIPVESTPVQSLPTLEPASAEELNDLAVNPTPASPQELGEIESGDTPEDMPVAPVKEGAVPLWIHVEKIALEAPIISAESAVVEVEENGQTYQFVQWEAPNEAAVGWHADSARLGVVGNTVLNGHHNAYGRVFRNLVYLEEGDYIQIYGDDGEWYTYIVANKMVLPEWNVTLEQRMQNAAWILPSQDERLTLITCWPEQTNSHRLIIVARPVHW